MVKEIKEKETKEKEVKHKDTKQKKSVYTDTLVILAVALIVVSFYNLSQTTYLNNQINERLQESEEAARPAEIGIITLIDKDCENCFDITPIVESLKKANVDISEEAELEFDSEQSKKLIEKYNVEKIPTLLVFGEIDKLNIRDMEKVEDALVFTKLTPIFTDAKTGEIRGEVNAVIVEPSNCDECAELTQLIGILEESGFQIVSQNSVSSSSTEGKNLISKYSLELLPAIIFSKDLGDYESPIVESWASSGSIEEDGSYVTRIANMPYFNISANKIVGLVSITYLDDNTCEECYDAQGFHKPILGSMGIAIGEETQLDVSSEDGAELIAKYDIKKVPAMILEGDVDKYAGLAGIWNQVGTIESDGAYVFRQAEVAGQKYLDIESGEVIDPRAASAATVESTESAASTTTAAS